MITKQPALCKTQSGETALPMHEPNQKPTCQGANSFIQFHIYPWG